MFVLDSLRFMVINVPLWNLYAGGWNIAPHVIVIAKTFTGS